MAKEKEQRTVQLKVTAKLLESKNEKAPKAAAYAFSSGGRILDRKALDDNGKATLTFSATDNPRSVRVIVGPEVEEKEPLLTELQRRGAEEHLLRIDPQNLTPAVEVSVFPSIWKCWLLGLCFVQGTLLKRVVSGGMNIDLPVCNATIEIYEVDPIYIIVPRLPDLIIEKIREVIINPPSPPPPPPDGVIDPLPPISPGRASNMQLRTAEMIKSSAQPHVLQASSSLSELQYLARTADTFQFRQALVQYAGILRHVFCLFFPAFVTTQLVATAKTDDCGHFRTFFFKGCNNPDQPDLYFKAKQKFLGYFNITIYAPTPIPCYTYWNYVCGTEVTLYTKHPLALTCPPCPIQVDPNTPNNWVLVMAVGNYPLSRIHGTSKQFYDDGITNSSNMGLTQDGEPFGGLLRLRIEFDNSLRDDLGVLYYQVSWRKGTSGNFNPMLDEVHRHYTHEVGTDLILELYPVGPLGPSSTPPAPIPNLFRIPEALPPVGQWSFPDLYEDLTSAKFPTLTYAGSMSVDEDGNYSGPDLSGEYQLKIDLFDAAGNLVNIDTLGIKYRVPKSTDLSGTIQTEDASAAPLNLVVDDDSDGKRSFIMTLHIDNNFCYGSITTPTIGGGAADPCCGVLKYGPGDSVKMDWRALHPHNFAYFNFFVVRGVNQVYASSPPNNIASGNFTVTLTVADMMSINLPPDCDPCVVAGFSENLWVQSMVTDGWTHFYSTSFFSGLDTSKAFGYSPNAVRAFVLTKIGPP